jgi:DNA-binding NtrC family response regulator
MMSVAPLLTVSGVSRAKDAYVLLVDDHEPSLRQLRELVRLSGHACIATSSITDALSHCDLCKPRVVVTDLTMPNLDGVGLARWLQARHPSVPMVLMTGQSFDPRSLDELQRTFTAVLPKPIDVDRFLDLLDRLMPRSENPSASRRP